MKRATFTLLVIATLVAAALLVAATRLRADQGIATGGSAAARELMEQELAKLPDNHIVKAAFTSPRPDKIQSGAPNRGDNWLDITARATSDPDAIVADWQATLVLASFSESAAARGVNEVDGAQLIVRNAAGETIDRNDFDLGAKMLGGGSDSVSSNHAAAEAKLIAQVGRGASAAHARFIRATFVELPELSVDLTLSTPDPASFVAHSGTELAKIVGDEQGLNGRLIRVVDEAGKPVLYASFVHRLNSGSKEYGDLVAVEDLTFTIESGQILGVLGPNGRFDLPVSKELEALWSYSPANGRF